GAGRARRHRRGRVRRPRAGGQEGRGRAGHRLGRVELSGLISDTNARLVAARRLTRRAARHETGRFLAEGAQAVREALGRSKVVLAVFATPEAIERNPELIEAARTQGVRVDEISVRSAAALSETVRPQGLVALCHQVDVPLRKAFETEPRL